MKPTNNKIQTLSASLLSGLLMMAVPALVNAQTTPQQQEGVDRTVVVEQEYNPEIKDADKINVVPKIVEPQIIPRQVEYETTVFPATTISRPPIGIYAGKEVQKSATPGYVRLGYGNNGNLDLRASYLFNLSDRDKLSLYAGMDGMNGKLQLPFIDEKWKSRYYRSHAGLNYLHQFSKVDMDIAANFGLSNFNYHPYTYNVSKQKFTSGDFHLGFASTDNNMPLQFKAETNLMLYSRQTNPFVNGSINETIVRTKADVTGDVNESQLVGIGAEMNNLFYSSQYADDYTTLLLKPYYKIKGEDWNVKFGANVDLSFGFGKSYRISPDVTAEYTFFDSYVLYAGATGGRLLNDFRRLEMVSPYGELDAAKKYDTYEQLNAHAGFRASPLTGLWFNIFGGYQMLKDDLYSTPTLVEDVNTMNSHLTFDQTNTNNLYLGGQISYDYKKLFSVSAEGKYYHWSADNEDALFFKPQMKLGFQADVHPIQPLTLSAGYEFIGWEKPANAVKQDAVNNLYLGASYEFFKGISAYARVNNLLNQKYKYYHLYPAQGLNFVVGLSLKF